MDETLYMLSQRVAETADKSVELASKITERAWASGSDKDPLFCEADGSCVYADSDSPTEYSACDENGSCQVLSACEPGSVMSDYEFKCVRPGEQCAPPRNNQNWLYTREGACSPAAECRDGFVWDGQKCVSINKGNLCGETEDHFVKRLDETNQCKVVPYECSGIHVYSAMTRSCVVEGDACGEEKTALDNKVRRFTSGGQCVSSGECVDGWEPQGEMCVWQMHGQSCEPETPRTDPMRQYIYDPTGKCIPSSKCTENMWEIDPETGMCSFTGQEERCDTISHRIYRYDKNGVCVPGDCEEGFRLVNDTCLFDSTGQDCTDEEELEVHRYDSTGVCRGTGRCINDRYAFVDGKCEEDFLMCPEGFTPVEDGLCYRLFDVGEDGRTSVSFSIVSSYSVKTKYTFTRNKDSGAGNYDVSSNFGLNGGAGGIKNTHSTSSSWTSGYSKYTVKARQENGRGILEVWVKN